MMDLLPLYPASEGWDQDLKTMVLPMSLDEYMDCFWADEAPFFIPGHLTGPEDRIVNYTNWLEPTDEDELLFSSDVIAYRMVEKDLQDSLYTQIWSTINSVQHIELMEQSPTKVSIVVLVTQSGFTFADTYTQWY